VDIDYELAQLRSNIAQVRRDIERVDGILTKHLKTHGAHVQRALLADLSEATGLLYGLARNTNEANKQVFLEGPSPTPYYWTDHPGEEGQVIAMVLKSGATEIAATFVGGKWIASDGSGEFDVFATCESLEEPPVG
jgi:hypothetical protein